MTSSSTNTGTPLRWLMTILATALASNAEAFVPIISHSSTFQHDCPTAIQSSSVYHDDFGEEDLQVAGVVIDDLSWRVDKFRLEEENRKRFLKAKPRFLPYEECRKWVQAFNRWNSEQEWKSWVAMGEKRNSYIPSRPDEYYSDTGDWISWDHFLGVPSSSGCTDEEKDNSSN